ncbi:MAG TPA: AIR synthase-related protein, partial [Myxococcota bacterium]|nr:AIR synthase-related protein [Myxococcota bacterium]
LHSLLRASSSSVRLFLDQIPLLPGVEGLLRRGLRSSFHSQNFRLSRHFPGDPEDPRYQALFDPQTAGGMLVGVPADRADALLLALRAGPAPEAAIIGEVSAGPAGGPAPTS